MLFPEGYEQYLPSAEEAEAYRFENELIQRLMQEKEALQTRIEALERENVKLKELLRKAAEASSPQPQTPAGSRQEHLCIGRRRRLLVFGDSMVQPDQLLGIAKSIGFDKEDIELKLDYEKNERYDLKNLRYHSPYSCILVGPNAHKMVGLGSYSSMIGKLKNEPGYPYTEEIRTESGALKITKNAFRQALRNVRNYLVATDA